MEGNLVLLRAASIEMIVDTLATLRKSRNAFEPE